MMGDLLAKSIHSNTKQMPGDHWVSLAFYFCKLWQKNIQTFHFKYSEYSLFTILVFRNAMKANN